MLIFLKVRRLWYNTTKCQELHLSKQGIYNFVSVIRLFIYIATTCICTATTLCLRSCTTEITLLFPQITFLLCGIAFGEVSTRKTIYYGLLTGNILSVAMYAAFVHSMSVWNAINVSFVAVLSTFTMFRIIVLILSPRWWVWKIRPLT